jgi:EAL domain-containing protein (putative c-di-GMP-specific phosphodiesterase class I)
MYRSKEEGGNKYQYYEPNINNESIERLKLETRLRRALERNEFVLYYQPKVSLITGKLSGFEALLRWSPSEEEMISPARFIPILEDTGLIVPVGEWVLRTACQQAKQWQVYLPDNAKMAVNLSARQFQDANLSQLVADVLDETGLDAEYLELEITESMLMEDTDHTIKILQQLHDMGIHLSIDDFGTGYSSLAYLKRMPIGTLKIDRSFVKDITTDSNDATVVQTIIAMAHTLKLRVIAEGSETADQIQFLREQQCDETQGFYFSRPLPANQLRPMLEDGQELLSYNFSDKSMQENNCVPITKKQT